MSQSRILSVSDAQYDELLQRNRAEHFLEREASLVQEAKRRARQRREREQGERRGPGRPRKYPMINTTNINTGAITNSTVTIHGNGNGVVVIDGSECDSSTPPPSSESSSPSTSSSTPSSSPTSPPSSTSSPSPPPSAPPISAAPTSSSSPLQKASRIDWVANVPLFNIITAAVSKHRSYARAVRLLQKDETTAAAFCSHREHCSDVV